jgi:hypothetical protein
LLFTVYKTKKSPGFKAGAAMKRIKKIAFWTVKSTKSTFEGDTFGEYRSI